MATRRHRRISPTTPGAALVLERDFTHEVLREADELARVFGEHQRFLLTTHEDPDGDGLGAEAALAAALERLGKTVTVFNNDTTPAQYGFLDQGGLFQRYQPGKHRAVVAQSEVVILLDAARPDRTGRLASALAAFGGRTAAIDHHPGGGWAEIEILEPDACSTTELTCLVLDCLGLELSVRLSEALYTGVLVDTNGFTLNISPRAHRLAARLLDAGADAARVQEAVFASWPLGRLRLRGEFLNSLRTRHRGQLVWGAVSRETMRRFRQPSDAVEGLVEEALTVRGAKLAILFLEEPHSRTRISLRSRGDIRVDVLAHALGGGGHPQAAGARVRMALSAVIHEVLAKASTILDPREPPK